MYPYFPLQYVEQNCPPYNIQTAAFIPSYRKMYLPIWHFSPSGRSTWPLYSTHISLIKFSQALLHHKSLVTQQFSIGLVTYTKVKMLWAIVKYIAYCGLCCYRVYKNLQTARGFYAAFVHILCKWSPRIYDIFLKFLQFDRIRRGVPNRVTRSSYYII